MAVRGFSNTAVVTTETGLATNIGPTLTLTSATGWPTAPFTAVVEPGTANAEVILVGARTTTACSAITRGYDGTTAVTHPSGSVIAAEVCAIDFSEANAHHQQGVGAAHGLTVQPFSGSASVVTGATVTTVVNAAMTVPANCTNVVAMFSLTYSAVNKTSFTIKLGASAFNGSGNHWVNIPDGSTYSWYMVCFLAAPPTGAQSLVIASVASTATTTATATIAGQLMYLT